MLYQQLGSLSLFFILSYFQAIISILNYFIIKLVASIIPTNYRLELVLKRFEEEHSNEPEIDNLLLLTLII